MTVLMALFALSVALEAVPRVPRGLVRLTGLIIVLFALASLFLKIRVPISRDMDFALTIASSALAMIAGLFLALRPAKASERPGRQPIAGDGADRGRAR